MPTIPGFTGILETRYNYRMGVHHIKDQTAQQKSVSMLACLLITALVAGSLPQVSKGGETSVSTQLLQSYFDTAGVCTNSSVESITETAEHITVNITIEQETAKALRGVSSKLKDDWFSLHCPPEIHGVWRQPTPPEDVLINGALDDIEHHELSCRIYQEAQYTQVLTFGDRIREALERLLAH